MARTFEYDVALSFAGEDRAYVDQVANSLTERKVAVFYDRFEEAKLWGKNLYDYLTDIYQNKARFTVVFISSHYARKVWVTLERQAMQARAFQESNEYILPARFDQTDIPGLLPTTNYVPLTNKSPSELAELIVKKLIDSGASIPSEQLRRNFSTTRKTPKIDPILFEVRLISSGGVPIAGADLVAIADNATIVSASRDHEGRAHFSFRV